MKKIIDPNTMIKIQGRDISIGLSMDIIEKIFSGLSEQEIKKEYLYYSFPEQPVKVYPFSIGKKLITISEFAEFISATAYITQAEKDGWGWTWENGWSKKSGLTWETPFRNSADELYLDNSGTFPVLMLSWNDAHSYCTWLSDETGSKVKLPDENEWELFADTVGVKSIEQTDISPNTVKQEIHNSMEFMDLLYKEITTQDEIFMPGLLWEWTDDWFDSYPSGITSKEFGEIYKVLRGGSLISHAVQKSRQYRFRRCPTARSPFYGFRIVVPELKKASV